MKNLCSACTIAVVSQLCSAMVFAGVVTDGTLGQAGALAGPNYAITSNLGKQYGANLFHSFSTFNLSKGEIAQFSGAASIQNIISRVTGGSASSIDGTISSSILGANVYLVNPSGIMFGPSASLDISGSFHASTADYIKLGSDGKFDARTPAQSVLTSSPPSAFGFVTSQPAPITVQGSGSDFAYNTFGLLGLYVPEGKTISLIGGDIDVASGLLDDKIVEPWLIASGGRVNMASVASSGEVNIENNNLTMNGFTTLGNITLNGNGHISLEPSSGAAGNLYIRGNNFYMDRFAIGAYSTDSFDGGAMDVRLNGDMKLSGSSIKATGDQLYRASNVYITNASTIGANGIKTITIEAKNVELSDANSRIESLYGVDNSGTAANNGGDILITADILKLDGGKILTNTNGSGAAGNILLATPTLTLDHQAFISTQTNNAGNAGSISANVGKVTIKGGSDIDSNTNGSGNGGIISVNALESINIDGYFLDTSGNYIKSSIQAGSTSTGNGGQIALVTPILNLDNKAGISTQTESQGNAGTITLDVGSLAIKADSGIVSDTHGSGNGGLITINASESIALDGYSIDSTGKYSSSGIQSAALAGSSGHSGSIKITTPLLTMSNLSLISTQTRSQGAAGQISMDLGTLNMRDGAAISSSTFGSGNGGAIAITATNGIVLDGFKVKASDPNKYFNTGIYSDVGQNSTGNGGSISVQTPGLTMNNFAYISSAVEWDIDPGASVGQGGAGKIALDVGKLYVTGGSTIASSTAGPGNGGAITTNAKDLVEIQGYIQKNDGTYAYSEISGKATGAGNGGSLFITTPLLDMKDKGRITVATSVSGKGGDMTLNVDNLHMQRNSAISSESTGTGNAGNIIVNASNNVKLQDSFITAATLNADGGNIKIDPVLINLLNSSITATAKGGTGNGGNVNMRGYSIILDHSKIIANSDGGTGGNISITSNQFITSADSIVTASSRLGVQGTVDINAIVSDVSNGLVEMPNTFLDMDSLVPKQCATKDEEISSFAVTVTGIPPRPDQTYLSK
ncbi:MAG: filamentous hemagglutinin N-terminal domain-containing protein [Desulfuromonadaceae bacterium]